MLFDLRGKRRRAVQVVYLGLALLMGIGLVGAGVGSDVSGGLFDIFGSGSGGDVSDANKPIKKKVDAAEKRLKTNPNDAVALVQVVRGRYTLATADTDSQTGAFGEDGKKELEKASTAWKRYLATKPEKIDDGLANLMLTAYSPTGLNQPDNGTETAEIVAEKRNDAASYIQLLQYALVGGPQRKADLAADKAIELAPKGEEKTVKQLIEQARASAASAGGGGATGGAGPTPGGG